MCLDGKVVMITGASGGLGQAVVPVFLGVGAKVVTVERTPPSNPVTGLLSLTGDVTDEGAVTRLVADALARMGRIDALVNLVGAFASGRLAETTLVQWQRMLTLNVTAAFVLSKAVIPHMVARGSGRIVHIASRAAVEAFPGAAAYVVAKSALAALIRVLALELGGTGVTINGILPTTIDTPANRKNMPAVDPSKWVKPEAIAEILVFLASEQASEVHGALIPVGQA